MSSVLVFLFFIMDDHFAHFELSFEYDKYLGAVFAFLSEDLTTVAFFLMHAKMYTLELILRQKLQERYLSEESFNFLKLLAVNMI